MINSILEELEKLLHNRMIVIILFIIPIAANFLIGFVFQSSQITRIPMAVVDHDQSGLSRMIIRQFAENETFSMKYMVEDENRLREMLEAGTINTGMVIPEGFSEDVSRLKSPSILMLYDGSHMSIASTAKSKASEILMTLKTGTAIKLVGGKLSFPEDVSMKTVLTIGFSSRFIYNPTRSYSNTLNPGLGAAAVQTGIILLGAVCIRRERLYGSIADSMGYILGKVVFYGLLGTVSLMCSVYIQAFIFRIPMKSSLAAVLLFSLLMAAAEAACAVMISVWVCDTTLASLVAAVFFIPSTALGGYTWPRLSMPGLYKSVTFLMPFTHFGDSLRSLYLKGLSASVLMSDIEWFFSFTAAVTAFAAIGVFVWNLPVFSGKAALNKGEEADVIC